MSRLYISRGIQRSAKWQMIEIAGKSLPAAHDSSAMERQSAAGITKVHFSRSIARFTLGSLGFSMLRSVTA